LSPTAADGLLRELRGESCLVVGAVAMSRPIGVWKRGDPAVLLSATGLAITLALLLGMIALVAWQGVGTFWPNGVVHLETKQGRKAVAEIVRSEVGPNGERLSVKLGNRDVEGLEFAWIDVRDLVKVETPAEAAVVERMTWGDFHGYLVAVKTPEGEAATTDDERFAALDDAIDAQTKKEKGLGAETLWRTAAGREVKLTAGELVAAWRPNKMGFFAKLGHYLAGVWEFVSGEPRESNTEGGIWPAIFGTCLMVVLMSIAVVPFGVMAAIYLHEYAKQGPLVRLVRIAIANLAGVPSIVFGLFGLGFFVYTVGGSLDRLFFDDRLPNPTFGTGGILWGALTLALLTVPVVIVATEEALAAVPSANREGALALGSTKWEMIRRVVLPHAMPGVLTGMILAVARGAGEVAPLMLTGAVKLAKDMPFDAAAPYVHLDRKFMHLGFHIYDLGFQSPNVEAAKPMVYATTLLLILLVVALNVTAIVVRAKLRRKLEGHAF
jgi:phosphate transport system permease protein